ncbi:MAG: glycosyltransferase, partial [bacterium]
MNKELITVFIPTFNRLELLKVAVASVLDQGDFVILHVLDNASTDGTKEWLLDLAHTNPRVRLTIRESNLGYLANFSDAFSKIDTAYAVPLQDDDALLPGFLKSALSIAMNNPDLGAVVFQTEIWKEGRKIALSPRNAPNKKLSIHDHLVNWTCNGHYFSWSSILWSSKALFHIQANEAVAKFGPLSDAWIQFKIFSQYPAYLKAQSGAILNIHDNQVSRGVGPLNIKDIGIMAQLIRTALETDQVLSPQEISAAVLNLFKNWNPMVEGQCWQQLSQLTELDAKNCFQDYLEYVYPQVGFFQFPLLPLLEKYRTVITELQRVQGVAATLEGRVKFLLTQKNEPVKKAAPLPQAPQIVEKQPVLEPTPPAIADSPLHPCSLAPSLPSLAGKKVLVFADEPGIGGVGHYTHSILLALAEAKADVFSAQPEWDSPLIKAQREAGIKHVWTGYNPVTQFARSFSDKEDAARILSEVAPDVILFSDCCPISHLAAKQVAMDFLIPYVVSCAVEATY